MNVSSTSDVDVTTIAGAGALGFSNVGVGAAVGVNIIENDNLALIGSGVDADATGTITVQASSTDTLSALTGGAALSTGSSVAGSVSVNITGSTTEARIDSGADVDAGGAVSVIAVGDSTISAIVATVSIGFNAGIGAAFTGNFLDSDVEAEIQSADVTSTGGGVTVEADSMALIETIAAGGAGAGQVAIGGAVAVNDLDGTVAARITGASSDINAAGTVTVSADANSPTIQSLAGQVTGAGSAAIGAAVATNSIDTVVEAVLTGATVVAGALIVSSVSGGLIETISAGASIGGQVALTGAVSVNNLNGQTRSRVAGGADVTTSGSVTVSANDSPTIRSLSGQVSGAGAAAIGGSAAYNNLSATAEATIDNASVTSTGGSIAVTADTGGTIETLSAGGSFGGVVGVAGSVAVNIMENTTVASIDNGSTVDADDNLTVLADTTNTIETWGGTVAIGLTVGVGGTVVTNFVENDTRAFIAHSTVFGRGNGGTTAVPQWSGTGVESTDNMRGVAVIATADQTIDVRSVTASGGLVGVAGNVSVSRAEDTTEAYIAASDVNSSGDFGAEVLVRAHQNTAVDVLAGALSGGFVAVGAGVDTTRVDNRTQAFISESEADSFFVASDPSATPSQVYSGQGVEVSSTTVEDVDIGVVGVGGGAVAVSGSVSVVNISAESQAYIDHSDVYSLGDLSVRADDTATIDTVVGAIAGSAFGSAGGSVTVNNIETVTRARVTGGDLNATGDLEVIADSDQSIDTTAITGSGGLFVGLAGAVSVNTIEATTEALVEPGSPVRFNADPDFRQGGAFAPTTAQTITIAADDTASIDGIAGAFTGGAVGIGASIDVGAIRNRTVARVGQEADLYAVGDIAITADSDQTMSSGVGAFAGGLLGLSGAISVLSLGAPIASEGAAEFTGGLESQVEGDTSVDALSLNSSDMSAQSVASSADSKAGAIPDPTLDDELNVAANTSNIVTAAVVDDGSVSTGATITSASGDVTVAAAKVYDVDILAGNLSVGAASLGASVGVATINNTVEASIGTNASVEAGDDIVVSASDAQKSGTSNNDVYAGAVGIVGASGGISITRLDSNVDAYIDNNVDIVDADDIDVTATQTSNIDSDALGASIGLAAAGVSVTLVDIDADVDAYVDDGATVGTSGDRAGSLDVLATSTNTAIVDSLAIAAGGLAGQAAIADALIDSDADARLGDVTVFTTGSTTVIGRNKNTADADADGIAGGLLAGGATLATAEVTGAVSGRVDSGASLTVGTNSTSGDLIVTAEASNTAKAVADGTAIGLVSGTATFADAKSDVDAQAIVGDVTVDASRNVIVSANHYGFADADADGLGVGLVSGGAAFADAEVRGDNDAAIGSGSVIDAGTTGIAGDVTVRARSRDHMTGLSTPSRAEAYVKASAYGLLGGAAADTDVLLSTQYDAHIGDATVTASDDISILADARTETRSDAVGRSVGLIAAGFVSATSSMPSLSSTATSAAGASFDAGSDVVIQAESDHSLDADAEGGQGGLIAIGGADVSTSLSSVTIAEIGANTIVLAGDNFNLVAETTLDVQNEATENTPATFAGTNESEARTTVTSTTSANIGANSDIEASQVLVSARDVDAEIVAKTYANTSLAASSFNDTFSKVDATVTADVDIDANTEITANGLGGAGGLITIEARQERVKTFTRAEAKANGLLGSTTAIVQNLKVATANIDVADGSHFTAADVVVEAFSDKNNDTNYMEEAETDQHTVAGAIIEAVEGVATVVGEIVCLWGLICDAEGAIDAASDAVRGFTGNGDTVKTTADQGLPAPDVDSTINFNADVTFVGGGTPEAEIDANGFVTKSDGVTIRDGGGIVKGVGDQITTSDIHIDDIINNSPPGTIRIEAEGLVEGDSKFLFNNAFDDVIITNHSAKDLFINDIEVIDDSPTDPAVTIIGNPVTFTYDICSNSTETVVDIQNTNAAVRDITLQGHIINSGGVVTIRNAGGDIIADDTADYIDNTTYIETHELRLNAEQGVVGVVGGTPGRIIGRMIHNPVYGSPSVEAFGAGGVYLDLGAGTGNAGALNLELGGEGRSAGDLDQIASSAGDVDIQFNGGIRVTGGGITFEDTNLLLGDINAFGDVLVVGRVPIDSGSMMVLAETNLLVSDMIVAGADVGLYTRSGDILSNSASHIVEGDNIALGADVTLVGSTVVTAGSTTGRIGTSSSPIRTNLTGGSVSALAGGDIDVFETAGTMTLQEVESVGGDIEMYTDETAATNEDVVLPNGATVLASGGQVELLAGDDFTHSVGASITATGSVFLRADDGDAEAAAVTVDVHGALSAPYVEVTSENDNDTFNITSAPAFGLMRVMAREGTDDLTISIPVTIGTTVVVYGDRPVSEGPLAPDPDVIDASGSTQGLHIDGGGGDDDITGGSGDDVITGSAANDDVQAGAGADTVYGDAALLVDLGTAVVTAHQSGIPNLGTPGADNLFGNTGDDTIFGNGDRDKIFGEEGDDTADGGAGKDFILGDIGNDTLRGGSGNDFVSGGADTGLRLTLADLIPSEFGDYVDGDSGHDLVVGGLPVGYFQLENLVTQQFKELFDSSSANPLLDPAFETDTDFIALLNTLTTASTDGSDIVHGGHGNDLLTGDEGADNLYGDWGDDVVLGYRIGDVNAPDDDRLEGGPDNDNPMCGTLGENVMIGGTSDQNLDYILNDPGVAGALLSGGYTITSCELGDPVFEDPLPVELSGQKFEDADGDGVRDAGEVGLDGWVIELRDDSGALVAQTITASYDLNNDTFIDPETESGLYFFIDVTDGGDVVDLEAGTYQVLEQLEPDYYQTYPYSGLTLPLPNATLDATAVLLEVTAGVFAWGYETTLNSGPNPLDVETAEGLDFGNAPTGEIHGTKWEDVDGDGIQDPDEPVLEGWTIYLDENGNEMFDPGEPTQVTDENGEYWFTGLLPDTYTVGEIVQDGWVQTYPGSTLVPGTTEYFEFEDLPPVSYTPGSSTGIVDTAGNAATLSVDSLVQDGMTVPGNGVSVIGGGGLAGDSGNELVHLGATTRYTFTQTYDSASINFSYLGGLLNFSVNGELVELESIVDLNGMTVGGAIVTVDTSNLDAFGQGQGVITVVGAIGEIAIGGSELVTDHLCVHTDRSYLPGFHTVPVGVGEIVLGVDFGNARFASISGVKFNDANGDGAQDETETVEVDVVDGEGMTVTLTYWTDLDGDGMVDAAEPGLAGWTIYVDDNDNGVLDAGELFDVTDSEGNWQIDGLLPGTHVVREVLQAGFEQSAPGAPDFSHTVTLQSGEELTGVDFGNYQPTEISGVKWDDANANGVVDAGELPLAGWTIYLDVNNNGMHDPDEPFDVTDASGAFLFEDLTPTVYTVAEVPQAGYSQSFPGPIGTDGTHTVDLSVATTGFVMFGNFRSTTIEGVKYEDLNANGVRDPGEPGLAGWTIFVTSDLDTDGMTDAWAPQGYTQADDPDTPEDESGTYIIEHVPLGLVTVGEIDVPGWNQSEPGSPTSYAIDTSSGAAVTGVDFGNYQPGRITGYKFDDLDGDGVYDPQDGETLLTGWVFYLDLNNNGVFDVATEPFATTDDQPKPDGVPDIDTSGYFSFEGLTPGTYIVREVPLQGWRQTTPNDEPGEFAVEVLSGESVTVPFGNTQTGEIHGTKWNDANGDGVRDPGEEVLPGWTIYLDLNGNGQLDQDEPSQVTDENGEYWFTGLDAGTYTVAEVLIEGWEQTFPAGGGQAGPEYYDFEAVDRSRQYAVGSSIPILRTDGVVNTLLVEPFIDASGNPSSAGVVTVGVSGLAGDVGQELNLGGASVRIVFTEPLTQVMLNFSESGGTVNLEVNGDFRNVNDLVDLDGMIVGGVLVTVTMIPGETRGVLTLDGPVTELLIGGQEFYIDHLCVTPEGESGGPGVHVVDLDQGQVIVGVDFGNRQLPQPTGDLTGTVYLDADLNGDLDPGEFGVVGQVVFVDTNLNGVLDGGEPTQVTDEAGNYTFTGLSVGTYQIGVVTPAGVVLTEPVGGVQTASVSDGGVTADIDFGYCLTGDGNGDGVIDQADYALFLEAFDTVVGQQGYSAKFDFDGDGDIDFADLYEFNEVFGTTVFGGATSTVIEGSGSAPAVDPGVAETPNAPITTTSAVGAAALTEQEYQELLALLSGLSAADETAPVEGAATPPAWTIDPASPSAYDQLVARGVLGGGSSQSVVVGGGTNTITGVKWYDQNLNGIRDAGEPTLSGWTIFLDLDGDGALTAADVFDVTDASGVYEFLDVPDGFYIVGEILQPGWFQTFPQGGLHFVTVSGGIVAEGLDFGNFQETQGGAEIHGAKWDDKDGDGVRDPDEAGLAGWEIFLDLNLNGQYDPGEPLQTTDASGEYWFTNLPSGEYWVGEIQQPGWTQTFPDFSNGIHIVFLEDFQILNGIDFGNVGAPLGGSIHGTKWEDLDGDGVRGPAEPGLAGWTIYLDLNNNGMFDAGEPSQVTDANGDYWFTDLADGTYVVGEVQQPGWTQTFPDFNNGFWTVTIAGGQEVFGVDFGNRRDGGEIHGTKWEDLDGDGVRDAAEPGLAGWTIFLDLNGDGILNQGEPSQVTDENGDYWFTDLADGAYVVAEVQQQGWTQTFPDTNGGVWFITIEGAAQVFGVDFGNRRDLGEIHGTKYDDLNGNGRHDPGEPGVPGVTIYIDLNGNGEFDAGEPSAVTMDDDPLTSNENEAGMYWLTGLPPGEYVVGEVVPKGWTQTGPNISLADPEPVDPDLEVGDLVVVGDFNGDDLADIAIVQYQSTDWDFIVNRAEVNGFADPITVSPGASATHAVAGDLTGDGIDDVLLVGADGVVLIEGGSFSVTTLGVSYTTSPTSLVLGDFDGDGDLDVAGIGAGGSMQIDLFEGGAETGVTLFADLGLTSPVVEVIDFNLDGVDDLVVLGSARLTGGALRVFTDLTSQPTLLAETTAPTGAIDIATGDFNGDGDLDVAGVFSGQNGFYVAYGAGSPQEPRLLTPVLGDDTVGSVNSLSVGDFSHDGIDDLVVASNETGEFGVWSVDESRGATYTLFAADGTPLRAVATVDFNGDGRADVLTSSSAAGATASLDLRKQGPEGAYLVNLDQGQVVVGLDFFNARDGQLQGMKFEDLNCDGVHDPDEPGLAGVTIYVDLDGDGELDPDEPSAVTDANGNYVITGVPVGKHLVREVIPDGFFFSFPAAGFYEVTLTQSGQVVTGLDFGNFQLIELPDGIDYMYGQEGDDTLYGDNLVSDPCVVSLGDDDHLFGQEGDDLLVGQLRSDTYYFDPAPAQGVGDETDTVVELLGAGTDERWDEGIFDRLDFTALGPDEPVTVDLSGTPPASFTLANQIAQHDRPSEPSDVHRVVVGAAGQELHIEQIYGGAADDLLVGNAADNLINGHEGDDLMQGLGGDDVYEFTAAYAGDVDQVVELTGNDTLDFSAITVPVTADLTGTRSGWPIGQVADFGGQTVESPTASLLENVLGGSDADELIGNAAENFLSGGAGNDVINGLTGDDTLDGGADDDRFLFDPGWGNDTVIEDAGEGFDTIDFTAIAADLTATVGTNTINVTDGVNNASHTGGATNHIEQILGGSGNNEIIAANTPNTWIITGLNSGTLNGVIFTDMPNLTGGSDVDTFIFLPGGQITGDILGGGGADVFDLQQGLGVLGTIDGQGDSDTLLGPDASLIYNLTGADAGDISGLVGAFLDVENLTAGALFDELLVGAAGSLSGVYTGDTGGDRLTLTAGTNTVRFLGADSGDVVGVVNGFSGIANVLGGSGADTIELDGGTISGAVDGAGGTDTLIGDDVASAFVLTAPDAGTATGVIGGFSNIENLTGGSSADTFTLSGGTLSGAIDGAGGSDTLTGDNVANTFVITGPESGTATGVGSGFSNVESLVGNALSDSFTLSGGTLSGSIDGAGGVDTFTGDNVISTFTILGTNSGTATGLGTGFSNIENLVGGATVDIFVRSSGGLSGSIDGGAGGDILVGSGGADAFVVTGLDAGTATGVTGGFTDIENLAGDGDDDTFTLSGGVLSGGIDGGAGVDTFTADNVANTFTVDTANGGTVTGLGTTFADVERLVGGSTTDDFNLGLVGVITGEIVGGAGVDSLTRSLATTYTLTGADSGSATLITAFSGIEDLTGGAANDTFVLSGGTLSGAIDGGAGSDTLIGDNVANAFVLTGADAGAATGVGSGFSNIENLTGGTDADSFTLSGGTLSGAIDGDDGVDTLVGDNVASAFVITGADSGTATGVGLGFSNIENLTGGTAIDSFTLGAGTLSGTIDGGGGGDTLETSVATAVTFELTGADAGTVTGLGGVFTDIANLTGGSNDDTFLVGAGDSLTGLMLGGAGDDVFDITLDPLATFTVDGGSHTTGDTLNVTGDTPVAGVGVVTTADGASVTHTDIETVNLTSASSSLVVTGDSPVPVLLLDAAQSEAVIAAFGANGGGSEATGSADSEDLADLLLIDDYLGMEEDDGPPDAWEDPTEDDGYDALAEALASSWAEFDESEVVA